MWLFGRAILFQLDPALTAGCLIYASLWHWTLVSLKVLFENSAEILTCKYGLVRDCITFAVRKPLFFSGLQDVVANWGLVDNAIAIISLHTRKARLICATFQFCGFIIKRAIKSSVISKLSA